jgi:hypothetical protein
MIIGNATLRERFFRGPAATRRHTRAKNALTIANSITPKARLAAAVHDGKDANRILVDNVKDPVGKGPG